MKSEWNYEPGTVRWRRYNGDGDVRCYRPDKGWEAFADIIGQHPITGRWFRDGPQWWIKETYTGG